MPSCLEDVHEADQVMRTEKSENSKLPSESAAWNVSESDKKNPSP